MNDPQDLVRSLASGAIAGIAGGGVIYAAIGHTAFPLVVEALHIHSALVALVAHLLFSAVVGAGFGLLLGRFSRCAGFSIMWSTTYALLWWIAVPLALGPWLAGQFPGWSIEAARDGFPLLIAYLTGYGAVLGLVYSLLPGNWPMPNSAMGDVPGAHLPYWMLLRVVIIGGVAGSLGGLILGTWPVSAGTLSPSLALIRGSSTGVGGFAFWLGSFALGAIYGVLYRGEIRGAGSSIAWGAAYGYLWWVLGELTLLPIGLGRGVEWSLASARTSFAGLTSYLIWGLLLGIVYAALDRTWRELFAESLPWEREPEGAATRGFRAMGMGLLAGGFGGVVYAAALTYENGLPMLAGLVGARVSNHRLPGRGRGQRPVGRTVRRSVPAGQLQLRLIAHLGIGLRVGAMVRGAFVADPGDARAGPALEACGRSSCISLAHGGVCLWRNPGFGVPIPGATARPPLPSRIAEADSLCHSSRGGDTDTRAVGFGLDVERAAADAAGGVALERRSHT